MGTQDTQTQEPQAQEQSSYSLDTNVNREQPLGQDERAVMDTRTGTLTAVPKAMSDQEARYWIESQDQMTQPKNYKAPFYNRVMQAVDTGGASENVFQPWSRVGEDFLKNGLQGLSMNIYRPSQQEEQFYQTFQRGTSKLDQTIGQLGAFVGVGKAVGVVAGLGAAGLSAMGVGALPDAFTALIAKFGIQGATKIAAATGAAANMEATGTIVSSTSRIQSELKDGQPVDYGKDIGEAAASSIPWALVMGAGAAIAKPFEDISPLFKEKPMSTGEAAGEMAKRISFVAGTTYTLMRADGSSHEDSLLTSTLMTGLALVHGGGELADATARGKIGQEAINAYARYIKESNFAIPDPNAYEIGKQIVTDIGKATIEQSKPISTEEQAGEQMAAEGGPVMEQIAKDPALSKQLMNNLVMQVVLPEGEGKQTTDTTKVEETSKDATGEVTPEAQSPLHEEALKYKSSEEFVKAKFKRPEYGMSHRPTYEGMPPSYNLLEGETLPRDVYDKPDFSIASGRIKSGDKAANESWKVLQKIKDNPEADVILYRAGARNELNPGDWVTFSREYAKLSAEGTEKVHSFNAKAKDVIFAGDDINEFGYYPKDNLTKIWNEAHQGEQNAEGGGGSVKEGSEQAQGLVGQTQEGAVESKGGEVVQGEQGNKESGIAKSIEAKAIEDGLISKGLDKLAGYESSTIKEQARIFTDTVNNKGIDEVRAIIRGEKPLPEGSKGFPFIVSMEAYLKDHPNPEIVQELANSPLTSAASEAASELGLGQNRAQDSFTAKINEIRKAKIEKAGGKEKVSKSKKKIVKDLKEATDRINLTDKELGTLDKFFEEIGC